MFWSLEFASNFLRMKIKLNILFLIVIGTVFPAFSQLNLKIYALQNINIIDVKNEVVLSNQTIIIKGESIFKIFPTSNQKLADSIYVFKCDGKFVLPGLIDTHCHLSGDALDANNTENTKKVLENMLYSGITTIRDMAGDARFIGFLAREAKIGMINSPNIFYSAILAGPKFFSVEKAKATSLGGTAGKMPYMQEITDTTNIQLAIARAKGSGASAVKLYVYLSKELTKKIIFEALKQKMLVWSHAFVDPAKPYDVVEAGAQVISHAETLWTTNLDTIPRAWKKADPTPASWDEKVKEMKLEKIFALMKSKGTILDATLSVFLEMVKKEPYKKWRFELACAITRAAKKSGVKICTGTDTDQKSFVQEEIKLLINQCGFSTFEALKSATLTSAEACGIVKSNGSIEEGKIADLAVYKLNPIADINNLQSVDFVIKTGKIYSHSK